MLAPYQPMPALVVDHLGSRGKARSIVETVLGVVESALAQATHVASCLTHGETANPRVDPGIVSEPCETLSSPVDGERHADRCASAAPSCRRSVPSFGAAANASYA